MIPAQLLHRVLRNMLTVDGNTDNATRFKVEDVVSRFDLDVEDFATLARVAAGEAWEGRTPE